MTQTRIEPAEAVALVHQPGVRAEVVGDSGRIFDDDILVRFHLPDGRIVSYVAVQESDYYGGEYNYIRWLFSDGETEEAEETGGDISPPRPAASHLWADTYDPEATTE